MDNDYQSADEGDSDSNVSEEEDSVDMEQHTINKEESKDYKDKESLADQESLVNDNE